MDVRKLSAGVNRKYKDFPAEPTQAELTGMLTHIVMNLGVKTIINEDAMDKSESKKQGSVDIKYLKYKAKQITMFVKHITVVKIEGLEKAIMDALREVVAKRIKNHVDPDKVMLEVFGDEPEHIFIMDVNTLSNMIFEGIKPATPSFDQITEIREFCRDMIVLRYTDKYPDIELTDAVRDKALASVSRNTVDKRIKELIADGKVYSHITEGYESYKAVK